MSRAIEEESSWLSSLSFISSSNVLKPVAMLVMTLLLSSLINIQTANAQIFSFTFGDYGQNYGQFHEPYGVAVDSTGKIYVADTYNERIVVFNPSGNFLFGFGRWGTENGEFNEPYGVAVDSTGKIYVADTDYGRIQVFNSSGNFLYKFDTEGWRNGQFIHPSGVAVGSTGEIYVADTYNDRIQVFFGLQSSAASLEPHNFIGFYPPVYNPPKVNVAKAGSAVPVKFSLDGYYGMDILEVGYPGSQQIECDSLDPLDIVEETVSAGSRGLSYDESTDQYSYV